MNAGRPHACHRVVWQIDQQPLVGLKRQLGLSLPAQECIKQAARRDGSIHHRIAGLVTVGEQCDNARRNVESDRITGAARGASIS